MEYYHTHVWTVVSAPPLTNRLPWDHMGILTRTIYIYIHCPECLSHTTVPWNHMGTLGNVLTLLCILSSVSVPSRCTMGPHGNVLLCTTYNNVSRVFVPSGYSIGPYTCNNPGECVLIYTIYNNVCCPECLSHPAIPRITWKSLGMY